MRASDLRSLQIATIRSDELCLVLLEQPSLDLTFGTESRPLYTTTLVPIFLRR
jgi:hypothetical protein